jgi:hypothetical protein
VKLTIELDREEDGRWIAEALELPGESRSAPAFRVRFQHDEILNAFTAARLYRRRERRSCRACRRRR